MTTESILRTWTREINKLIAEWESSIEAAATRSFVRDKAQTAQWRTDLEYLRRRQEVLRVNGHWYHGRPDLLGVLGRQRRELYHTAVLAWLLDPGTAHGLKEGFLGRFLNSIEVKLDSDENLHRVEVACEVAGPASRTDLVIRGEGFTVCVEVKVDADEGEDQCARMYSDFEAEVNAYFVFLTPTGRTPKTVTGEALSEFRSICFRHLRRMLSAALDHSKRGQMALDATDPAFAGFCGAINYLHTLHKEFP